MGFVSDLAQATVFLFTAMALYLLLKHVHELVARATAESIELLVVAPAAAGELWFVAYLLAKGIRVAEPKALVPVAA